MAPAPPALPSRFPCWCRAVYSWGGESKRDLGFIEGDLIECLNAGDGSWWTGRLWRDRRMVGVFPSNFVQVLDPSFRPTPKATTPAGGGGGSLRGPNAAGGAQTKTASKSFRKPFQAYARAGSPNPAALARDLGAQAGGGGSGGGSGGGGKTPTPIGSRQPSPAPSFASNNSRSRPENRRPRSRSPLPPASHSGHSRASSFNHEPYNPESIRPRSPLYVPQASPAVHSRNSSFNHDQTRLENVRARSPMPYAADSVHSRASSINNQFHPVDDSPPPPPPPPHRVQYRPTAATAPPPPPPGPPDEWYSHSARNSPSPRQPSPSAHSLMGIGQTPSPVRDAMEDVMSSLNGMGLNGEQSPGRRSPSPLAPWSPEAFDEMYKPRRPRQQTRPRSSLGIGGRDELESDDDYVYEHVQDVATADQGSGGEAFPMHHNHPDHNHPVEQQHPDELQSRPRSSRQKSDELFFATKGHAADGHGVVRRHPPPFQQPDPPLPPPTFYAAPPTYAMGRQGPGKGSFDSRMSYNSRRSAYDMGGDPLDRTSTVKSAATSNSSEAHSTSTQITSQSMMSGHSAGAFSATSAASLARRRGVGYGGGGGGLQDQRAMRAMTMNSREGANAFALPGNSLLLASSRQAECRPSGVTYHSGNIPSQNAAPAAAPPPFNRHWSADSSGGGGSSSSNALDGMLTPFNSGPKPKKSGFFKKIIESAKTSAAGARSSIASGQPTPPLSPLKSLLPNGVTSIAGGPAAAGRPVSAAGNGGGATVDWVQVRRDVNRSNSLSHNERVERRERCQMMDHLVIQPIDALYELAEGDEAADGTAVAEATNYQAVNFALVDKNTRYIAGVPVTTNPAVLAQHYVCRPYKSDAQRLRAVFTWVSEKVAWEEEFEGEIDVRRVIQTKRGCAEEVAVLVMEMCAAVGIVAEVVRGYLKSPGEVFEGGSSSGGGGGGGYGGGGSFPRPNHWWNAVLADGEWRLMDCSLASPTNPRRALYATHAGSHAAEGWWFLARPLELCFTHVPVVPEQQHICPPMAHELLFALPCAGPPYFRHGLHLLEFDTSQARVDGLELVHVHVLAPPDVECVAEVEAQALERDADGDYFESGEIVRKRALAQADWVCGEKRYTIKALLPGDEGQGVLKVYAGKRGLMHSYRDNPYPLAFAIPIIHTGTNPPYDFFVRHPTPHAQRHDLYVVQPQCARLAVNNTFVFAVRQHPSSVATSMSSDEESSASRTSSVGGVGGGVGRPGSALSIATSVSSTLGSVTSQSQQGGGPQKKPAKLAIQAPSGKIMRLMRKSEHMISTAGPGGGGGGESGSGDGGVWETIIKCGERGVWRGLVLADRSARWCVFAEWTCV